MDTEFLDSSFAKPREKQGLSLESFLASLTVAFVLFVAQIFAFAMLRSRLPSIYQPRAPDRIRPPPASFMNLLYSLLATTEGIRTHLGHGGGSDGYFFLRYLRVLLKIFVPMASLLIPLLLPLNLADQPISLSGLDRISWGNVSIEASHRYWAHLAAAMGVAGWVCMVIWSEMGRFVAERQQHLRGLNRKTAAVTLIRSIPVRFQAAENFRNFLAGLPGGVRHLWGTFHIPELMAKTRQRDTLAQKLEAAETRLLRRKLLAAPCEVQRETIYPSIPFLRPWALFSREPVDAIDFYRSEISRISNQLHDLSNGSHLGSSAFVQFNHPDTAELVCQTVQHATPGCMVPRDRVVSFEDMIWDNVALNWWQILVRRLVAAAAMVLTMALCIVPFALAGLLSQVIYLAEVVPWLGWLKDMPYWAVGVFQGILPPAVVGLITYVVSFCLRLIFEFSGLHSRLMVQRSIQRTFFLFLFVNLILIVTLAAGLAPFFEDLEHSPNSIPASLARNLPKASNYFYSYLILQALSTSAMGLLQVPKLVQRFLVSPWFDETVSERLLRRDSPAIVEWGTFFPMFSSSACIGITYSIISPVISCICALSFALFILVYRYNFFYVFQNPTDSAGMFYPVALKQLLVGVYAMELSVIGLFSLSGPLVPQASLMAMCLLATLGFHLALELTFGPLLKGMPVNFDPQYESEDVQRPALVSRSAEIRIPRDSGGLSEKLVKQNSNQATLAYSDLDATMDRGGNISLYTSSSHETGTY